MVDYLNTKVKKQEKVDYINTDQLKVSGSKLESIHLGYQYMKSLESMHQGQLDAQQAQLEQFQNLTNQCSAIQEELNLERENRQRIIAGQKAIDYPEDYRFLTKLSNRLWVTKKESNEFESLSHADYNFSVTTQMKSTLLTESKITLDGEDVAALETYHPTCNNEAASPDALLHWTATSNSQNRTLALERALAEKNQELNAFVDTCNGIAQGFSDSSWLSKGIHKLLSHYGVEDVPAFDETLFTDLRTKDDFAEKTKHSIQQLQVEEYKGSMESFAHSY